jgi:tetratricopeptide (TPR) repeat protein
MVNMKNKMTSKRLKAPDKLLKTMLEFVGYLKHNVKLYLSLAAVIVLITAVVVTVNHFTTAREESARKELYALGQKIQTVNPDKPEEVTKMIEDVLPKLGSTKARFEAQYMLAEIYYNTKNWDKAISNYDAVVKKGKGLVKELSLLGTAYSKENKNDVKGALEAFTKLKETDGSIYKAVAMLGVARCYQKLGDKNGALAAYESVIIAYPDTDFARLASAAKVEL